MSRSSSPASSPGRIAVYLAPEITSVAHATFRTGVAGAFRVTATGSPAPTFSESGRLPRGVKLHGGGLLAGVPAKGTGGRYQFTLTAGNGSATSAKQAFTLTVDQAPAFTSPGHVTFRAGKRKTFTIVTRGFPAARLAESGKLPAGIAFLPRRDGTATLSGKASRRARGRTFRITITARNGVVPAAHQALTIVIR